MLELSLVSGDNDANDTTGDYDPFRYSPIDFRHNDTTRAEFRISNYYAYDDGTAEYGIGLNQPGAQVEVVLRDGELVLVPHVAVPAETAWFWTESHQTAERDADADLTEGRHTDFADADALLAHLETIHNQTSPADGS